MITQTPSPNKTTPIKRREPLRWLIPAALLLLFLSICCIGQVVIVILSPRNQTSNLNLLSKDMADYSPWQILLRIPPIAPGAAAAQAADRATEAAEALLSPTPLVVAKVPTSEVIVIAAPQNAPTTTPGSALITPQPTVTPRAVVIGPTDTPVIGTVPPVETSVPTLVAIVPTNTPLPPTFTSTPIGVNPPTRTNTPVPPPTVTNSPRPADTATPTNVVRTPTRVPPSDTNTPVPPPSDTNTPVPPPSDTNTPVLLPTNTDTPVPPHNTNTAVPPPTKTNTAVPPPTRTPTPVASTATPSPTPTASNTVVPSTATNTATLTPVPPTATDTPTASATPTQTNTPTPTPLPSCGVGTGASLRIAKIASTYSTGANLQVTYTICMYNNTGAPLSIQDVQDTFPSAWSWVPFGACGPSTPTIGCAIPFSNGGTITWANPQAGQPFTIPNGQQLNLTVSGSYTGPAPGGQPWCNAYGKEFFVNALGNPLIEVDPVAACVTVQ